MSVTFEMDLDRMEYSRSRYTILDLLAQFGGFIGIFGRIFGFFMAAWNFNALENFMVTRLYKMRSSEPGDEKPGMSSCVEEFERSRYPHLGDYAMSWVPNPLVCCKKRGKEKAKARARSSLTAEMNMI